MPPRHSITLAALAILAGAALGPGPSRASGMPVCTAVGRQWDARIVPNPAGGAWLAWLDGRSGYSTDVYGCRLDGSGAPSTGGADQGTPLTWVTCLKRDFTLIADGTGGTIAAWSDHRCVSEFGYDIYLLRLGSDGLPAAGWPVNGTAVTAIPGWQLRPALAPDGAGGAFVVWVDDAFDPGRLRAHHVLPTGSLDPAWPATGVLLSSAVADSTTPAVGPDGAGGFYVAWDDERDGDVDIRLQRLTAAGSPAGGWPADGVGACTWPNDQHLAALVPGIAGATLAWEDRRGPAQQVYVCRFLPGGARAPGWPAGGRAAAPGGVAQSGVVALRSDVGGLRLVWNEDRGGGGGQDLYAQRLDSTGTVYPGWPAGGAPVCTAAGRQFEPSLSADAAGGMFVAWSDERDSAVTGTDVYVARLDASGAVAAGWPLDGAALSTDAGEQREPRLAGNGGGGAFALWSDGRNSATSDEDLATRVVTPGGPVSGLPSGLTAIHRNGQTFLRWGAPPGMGWRFDVYVSPGPIQSPADLAAATRLGSVGDSAACDRRFSVLAGGVHGYRIDPGAGDLAPGDGLFVRTVQVPGSSWYAVTSTPGAFAEDRTIVPGGNALTTPVTESPGVPQPVLQRTLQAMGRDVEVWTLWTWDQDEPGFPAMAGVPGLAFDFGLVRGAPAQAPLVVGFHARRGSFLDAVGGAFLPGEWVLAPDDALPNGENTFWFGYSPAYDVNSENNTPPDSGIVVGYTARRVDWTLDWVRRSFGIDTTRVFTYGYSMGGMGSSQLAFRSPGKIAGLMSVIGQFDYSFLDDPQPDCWFNPGGFFRTFTDQLWGTVATDLPTAEGPPVYQLLNETRIADDLQIRDLPPMLIFNGRKDVNVGWAEKTRFWQAMQSRRRGGYFFWDDRVHGSEGALWSPMQDPSYLDRFRTNRSFPALSNSDLDGDPGDGSPASGDTLGTLNGAFEWDIPSETPVGWQATLTLRTLTLTTGTIPAPESALVDVTPRRLQAFSVAPSGIVPFRVVRVSDEAVVASGFVTADSLGVVTVPAVRVYRTGSRLELGAPAVASVAPGGGRPGLRLSCASPAREGSVDAVVQWPAAGEARLELLDVMGRVTLSLFRGRVEAGSARYRTARGSVAPGVYFLDARNGGGRITRRIVVLR
ncbi:MAG: hypothetical protein IT347_01115 [Candidatus Eisenbacteria bacterium]|nr:hypothetical protein [Candidatus Eisenbacteria bacterium]